MYKLLSSNWKKTRHIRCTTRVKQRTKEKNKIKVSQKQNTIYYRLSIDDALFEPLN